MSADKEFAKLILQEIEDRQKRGEFVPHEAFEVAQDPEQIEDYSHMEVSACVDLIISLAQL